MADGAYGYPPGGGAHYRHLQQQSRLNRSGSPISFGRTLPSPTQSPSQDLMLNQGHQQGHNMLVNGPNQRYAFGMGNNKFHHQNHHLQTEHSNHRDNSVHWQTQSQLASEARSATGIPHFYARQFASQNKATVPPPPPPQQDDEERQRVSNITEASTPPPGRWVKMDICGQGIRSLSAAFFRFDMLETVYLNNNKLTKLPPAIGRLKLLTHLDLSSNMLSELPPEIGMLTRLQKFLLVDNNLHSLPYEMGTLYQLEVLAIEGNPLGEEFKSEIAQNGVKSLITSLRENAPATLPPPQRDWLLLDESPDLATMEKFTVMTYNTLCEKYATKQQYGYLPSQALAWDYRKELILSELREHNADFICQQEVDGHSFNEFFRPNLAYNDYKGVFWPKSRARTMAEKEAKMVDGCAIYYKGNKYMLLDKQFIDFANTAINRPDMKGEHDVFNRVMPRDQIAVIAFFENLRTGSRIIVANCHILWDPAFEDVKIVQVAILLDNLTRLSERYARWPPSTDKSLPKTYDGEDIPAEPVKLLPSQKYSSNTAIPLLLCGDFNIMNGGGVYELLSKSAISPLHRDFANRKYGNITRDGVTHPFSLKSSYSHVGELPFTNYTPGFVGVLDYIWYSTGQMSVIGLLGEVDKTYLERVPGFPNWNFPSDHIALLAEFALKGKK